MAVSFRNVWLKHLFALQLFFSSTNIAAQRIENESILRNIHSDHYFRFYYENDFISVIDYYYTSGMNIELVKPSLKKNPFNKLFFRLPESKMRYGLALDHYAFTPLHIAYSDILIDDRPYAGCISINSFRIATNEKKRRQISTSLILGLIGPDTFWEPVQTFLHKYVIPAPQPKGWNHQIQNDLILNYKISLEQNLVGAKSFILNGNLKGVAGTLNDQLGAGLSVMIGKMNDPFQMNVAKKKTEFYFFGQSLANVIGYDGTLQGGMLNRTSPYTVPTSNINRVTFQNQIGFKYHHKNFSIELSESFLSKEIKTGLSHKWGGLGIAFELK
jgi:hypothetical protein